LRLADPAADPPFQEWLDRHGQTRRICDRFWGLVLTSALNETPDRIGLRYARKVFVDGFLRHRRGFEVEVPTVPLGQLYGSELEGWLSRHGVEVRYQVGAKAVTFRDDRAASVVLRSGDSLPADWVISTVPFDRLLDLLPPDLLAGHEYFYNLKHLETSPITSVHLWYRRPITDLPHVVFVDCLGQWLFNRGEVRPGEHYVQIVVSAARQFRGLGHEEVQRRIAKELAALFPEADEGNLLRSRVVTEHAATFSAVPGVDRWRPRQESPIPNFFLAGDWTATGWPATMEGAVRSGYLAVEALLTRLGREERLVRPDLG
jgi:squalene-associated FAD-dependent desaturase